MTKDTSQTIGYSITALLDVMAKLRDPDKGCPWDREQTFETIAPYTIEEAYEVNDAITQGNQDNIKDELGDLLFQVVFYAQMAKEQGLYNFDDITHGVVNKMIRRHPHVFGSTTIATEAAQRVAWETHKAEERKSAQETNDRPPSVIDGVAMALPALMRAEKIQKRASGSGFDWPEIGPVYDKVMEELEETREAASKSPLKQDAIEDEVGDLLFACVNLARHLDVDPESALRRGNEKFSRRFKALEKILSTKNKTSADCTIEQLEEIWQSVKKEENEKFV
jgi:MazG family protein